MLYNYIDMDNLKGVKTIHMIRKEYESAVITMQKKGRHVASRTAKVREFQVSLTSVITAMAFVANTTLVIYQGSSDIMNKIEKERKIFQTKISKLMEYETEDSYNQIVEQEIARQMEEEARKKAEESLVDSTPSVVESTVESEGSEEKSMETVNSQIASPDVELLAKVTYAEAGNQTLEQQLAVAAVILNRVESESFPNTIQEVISQKGQFSSVKGGIVMAFGEPVAFSEVPESCVQAAERALAGEDPTEELLRQEAISKGLNPDEYARGGALYFYNPDYCGSSEIEMRNGIQVKVEYGDHIFYKVW